jgi:hypothetical protein
LLLRVRSLLPNIMLQQKRVALLGVVFAGAVSAKDQGRFASQSKRFFKNIRAFRLCLVQNNHHVPCLHDGEDGDVAEAGHGCGVAHVDQVEVPCACRCINGCGWAVVAADVGVHAGIAGMARVWNRGIDALAVAAELGYLGWVCVP